MQKGPEGASLGGEGEGIRRRAASLKKSVMLSLVNGMGTIVTAGNSRCTRPSRYGSFGTATLRPGVLRIHSALEKSARRWLGTTKARASSR